MEKAVLDLTKEEAAVALSVLVAFADDDPSDPEVVVMRKYYHYEALESLLDKMSKAGYEYPAGLKEAKVDIAKILQKADKNFRLRTMAVALLLAEADGVVDQREMNVINKFSHALGITLFDAQEYGKTALKEIDEVSDYFDIEMAVLEEVTIPMTLEEAGIALCTLVAFSDDDPADEEVGVIREHYSYEAAQSLQKKITAAGLKYPEELGKVKSDIMKALGEASRSDQLKTLAIAYKVSAADGIIRKEELAVMDKFCIEFGIGIKEVAEFFLTSVV